MIFWKFSVFGSLRIALTFFLVSSCFRLNWTSQPEIRFQQPQIGLPCLCQRLNHCFFPFTCESSCFKGWAKRVWWHSLHRQVLAVASARKARLVCGHHFRFGPHSCFDHLWADHQFFDICSSSSQQGQEHFLEQLHLHLPIMLARLERLAGLGGCYCRSFLDPTLSSIGI